uniref:Uncharacterized protein n=1 Tax=Cannabis sativa TaxID=3483 RepID=A0A803QFX3_CANSA
MNYNRKVQLAFKISKREPKSISTWKKPKSQPSGGYYPTRGLRYASEVQFPGITLPVAPQTSGMPSVQFQVTLGYSPNSVVAPAQTNYGLPGSGPTLRACTQYLFQSDSLVVNAATALEASQSKQSSKGSTRSESQLYKWIRNRLSYMREGQTRAQVPSRVVVQTPDVYAPKGVLPQNKGALLGQPPKLNGRVALIFGGPHIGGLTCNELKRYIRILDHDKEIWEVC